MPSLPSCCIEMRSHAGGTPRLVGATPLAGEGALRLVWDNGYRHEVSLARLMEQYALLAPLADAEVFHRVHVLHGGRCLEWPGILCICAHSLWFDFGPCSREALRSRVVASLPKLPMASAAP
ncbi:MAG: DUF2442 domain-containing protein [Magnetococcus sp. WYHC-3]